MTLASSLRAAAVVLTLLAPMPAYSQAQLDQILERLVSDDTDARRPAREALEAYLETLPPQQRLAVADRIVGLMLEPNYRVQLGVAVALSQLSNPWETSDTPRHIQAVYGLMQNFKDDTLRRYLDDALANAKGLYFDAIKDYNNVNDNDPGEIARVDAVREKFLAMSRLTESRFAGNAIYFLAQYYTKMATIFGKDKPELKQQFLTESDGFFRAYAQAAASGTFKPATFQAESAFFLALNQVLAGNSPAALDLLAKVAAINDERIYVYQFFYTRDGGTVLERSFDAERLAEVTTQFVQKYGNELPATKNQRELVKAVRGIK